MLAKSTLGQQATLLSWSNEDLYSVTRRHRFCLGTASGCGAISGDSPPQDRISASGIAELLRRLVGFLFSAAYLTSKMHLAIICPHLKNASSNYLPS